MPLLEDHTASFIVRIWREVGEGPAVCQEWRGSIEHVESGKRSFFRDLNAIPKFLQPYLTQLGIETPVRFWEVMTPELFEPAAETGDPATAPVPAKPPPAKRLRKR